MENLNRLLKVLFLFLLPIGLSAKVEMMTAGRGPASSSFSPTIKTCELIEDESYVTKHRFYNNLKLNESIRFCKEYISVKVNKGELEYTPCESPDDNPNYTNYDFEHHPNHFKDFSEILELYISSFLNLPLPKTKEPIDLSEGELKVLGYLCTRHFVEKAEQKLIKADSFRSTEDVMKLIEIVKKRGLLTYMMESTNTGVGVEILAFNKYPKDLQRKIFFLYLEEASVDEINRYEIKYFFKDIQYEIDNNTIENQDDDLDGKHMAMWGLRAYELIQEYKKLPIEEQKPEVLKFLKEVGF